MPTYPRDPLKPSREQRDSILLKVWVFCVSEGRCFWFNRPKVSVDYLIKPRDVLAGVIVRDVASVRLR